MSGQNGSRARDGALWLPDPPWERFPGESALAFEAFRVYRDLGPARTATKVAEHFEKLGRGRSVSALRQWSARWLWVRRAVAWDEEQHRLQDIAQEQARKDMAERHARIAGGLLTKLTHRLIGNEQAGVAAIDANTLAWPDLIRGIETAAKLERLARGEPTERSAQEHSGPGGGPVPVQHSVDAGQAAAVLAVLAQAGVIELPQGTAPLALEAGEEDR